MRFVVALALLALALTARAQADTCPAPLYLESSNGHYYVAVFDAPVAMHASLDLTFYSKTDTYTATLTNVAVDTHWQRAADDSGFRSYSVLFANPGRTPLLGATVRAYDLPRGTVCPPANVILPSVDDVVSPPVAPSAAELALQSAVGTEVGDGSNALAMYDTGKSSDTTCQMPFAEAKVTQFVKPVFPLATGAPIPVAAIRLELTETGAVHKAAVQLSSGNIAFDRAALDAARKTIFSPRVFGCTPEPATYVMRVAP